MLCVAGLIYNHHQTCAEYSSQGAWSSVAGKKYPRQSPPFVFIKTAALTSKYRCHQLTSFCRIQPTPGLAWTLELQLLLYTTLGQSRLVQASPTKININCHPGPYTGRAINEKFILRTFRKESLPTLRGIFPLLDSIKNK